jgi:hypothetical protein
MDDMSEALGDRDLYAAGGTGPRPSRARAQPLPPAALISISTRWVPRRSDSEFKTSVSKSESSVGRRPGRRASRLWLGRQLASESDKGPPAGSLRT